MQSYLQALSDFYGQIYAGAGIDGTQWPHSLDSLQERLGDANLVAFSQPFTRETLLLHLHRRRLPLLMVRRDWQLFFLALPIEKNLWDLWRNEQYIGRFHAEEVLQRGLGEEAYAYIIVPRGFHPSPFSKEVEAPSRRLARFFSAERQLVGYIYLYALVSGGASLLIPVVVQAIFTYIQTLQWVTGLTTLILLAALILITAALVRIGQYVLIEHLQRRLFLHSTLEIVYHVPRWLYPAVVRENLTGLINRYFEIFTLEKNISKLLLNVPADLLTITFGIILLSFYAPFFALSVLLLTGVVGAILYYSFHGTYKKKKAVSDEKYRMATWLEELARALLTFKVAGFPPLLHRRTQELEERYLRARKNYFSALLTQKGVLYFYQISIALIMLSLGALLVVEREISLGQFVASELVLFLILNAVQDLVGHLESLYDAFVGIDKLSQIFIPPTEKVTGIILPPKKSYSIEIRNLSFSSAQRNMIHTFLRDISLSIRAGEKVCFTGPMGSGKTTLLMTLYGLYKDYQGDIFIDGTNLRHIDLLTLRARIGDAIDLGEIIEGTLWENLTLGSPNLSWEAVNEMCEKLQLKPVIDKLPEGFFTMLPPQGRGVLSGLDLRRLLVARALLAQPAILFVDDIFTGVSWAIKEPIYKLILSPSAEYTAIVVSQDFRVMQMCQRVFVFEDGRLKCAGTYNEVTEHLHFIQPPLLS
ncbi:MAG: ATP-binding cassette domain-containing protein [Bacteroidia bacterium]|nr:ATP-binding cassette domain-containing protein [Bacteroidia bacterium]MCX7652894.1 ATP-binding cassette domain-containing protein [Bacteroidia bacterium]MDW8416638.1 ATP-binding cassette domain-containing protein [Bacteroidia bacterium]